MFESIVSMVPRTLWHILSVPDAAVSWKWLVELPSSLPKVIEGSGFAVQQQTLEKDSGFFSKIANGVADVVDTVTDTINSVTDAIDSVVGPIPLMMRAQEVVVPHEQIVSTTARTQARLRNFPDSIQISNLSITFYEDYNYSALSYFQKWRKCVINDYGVFRCPSGNDGYARTLKVHVFDTVGLKKGVFVFSNCYPEQIESYTYGSDVGSIKTTCSFSTNRVSFEPSGLLNAGSTLSSAQALVGNLTGDSLIRNTFNKIVG